MQIYRIFSLYSENKTIQWYSILITLLDELTFTLEPKKPTVCPVRWGCYHGWLSLPFLIMEKVLHRCGKWVYIFRRMIWIFCIRWPNPGTRWFWLRPRSRLKFWRNQSKLEQRGTLFSLEWWSWIWLRSRTFHRPEPNRVLEWECCDRRFCCNRWRCRDWCSYTNRPNLELPHQLTVSFSTSSE